MLQKPTTMTPERPDRPINPGVPEPPMAVMRKFLEDSEISFEVADDGSHLLTGFTLKNLDVRVVLWGEPDGVAVVIVSLPIRIPEEARSVVGEFLHRANYDATRPIWEMDYRDGEVRLRSCADTTLGPLTGEQFRQALGFLLRVADTFFPFLTAVMTRAMKPEMALDQAEAAYAAESQRRKDDAGDPPTPEA